MHAFESLPQRPPREPRDLKRRHREVQPDPPIAATAAHDDRDDSVSSSDIAGALLPVAVCAPPTTATATAHGTASSHLEPESVSASAGSSASVDAAPVAADASSMSDAADSLATRHDESQCTAARFDADGELIIREHQWEYLDHPADVQVRTTTYLISSCSVTLNADSLRLHSHVFLNHCRSLPFLHTSSVRSH
jgi:hypothetical protein